jgi:hypothetical protein
MLSFTHFLIYCASPKRTFCHHRDLIKIPISMTNKINSINPKIHDDNAKIDNIYLNKFNSIDPLTNSIYTSVCSAKPRVVGQPFASAISPKKPPNIFWVNL